jgi:SAM-dependent methyltransferase
MTDMWATFNELDRALQERLADALETRGADPQQQALRCAWLDELDLPPRAHVLEVGCGTGVLTRRLARRPAVGTLVATDPAPLLLDKARALGAELPNVTFRQADGRCLPFEPETFDAVVLDSVFSHMPDPELGVAEAWRVLRRPGRLAVFDGDYATVTVALGDHDPLQACVERALANLVHDRWVARRLPGLVRDAGFEDVRTRSHGFVETVEGGYMLTLVDRGVDLLLGSGLVGAETAAALKAEARRRVRLGTFFGHIAYASLVARKGAARA